MLDAARKQAREVGHAGALYPWRTISGDEASAWYASGTAQYHQRRHRVRDAQYNRVTGDLGFMLEQGAEVLVETARLDGARLLRRPPRRPLLDHGRDRAGRVHDRRRQQRLHEPDGEGEPRDRRANPEWLQGADRLAYEALASATGLTDDEIDRMAPGGGARCTSRATTSSASCSDEHSLERKCWDFENTPPENYPLLLNYHPLELYRHQVIKQTDVVLATYLVGHHFTEDEKRRTFDYYDPLDGRLEPLGGDQSVIASEVGYADAALDYFLDAVAVDLPTPTATRPTASTSPRPARTGWPDRRLRGPARSDGEVHFRPRLPEGWERLRFRVQVRGQVIEVDVTPEETDLHAPRGRGLLIFDGGEPIRLVPEDELIAA